MREHCCKKNKPYSIVPGVTRRIYFYGQDDLRLLINSKSDLNARISGLSTALNILARVDVEIKGLVESICLMWGKLH